MRNNKRQDRIWVVALSGILLLQACEGSRPQSERVEASPVAVKVLPLEAAPIEQIYEAAGAVRARQRAVLASKLQATVVAVPVKLGDAVREGQLLVELDHNETDAEYRRAQAALDAAVSGTRQGQTALVRHRHASYWRPCPCLRTQANMNNDIQYQGESYKSQRDSTLFRINCSLLNLSSQTVLYSSRSSLPR